MLGQSQIAADPFILKWNGEYYLYASGDPILAYHSTDLVNWKLLGPVLSSSKKLDAWNQADVWAPEVVYRNGKFYLYYTASRASADWRVGEMALRIGVAWSDSPTGPFVDAGHPVTPGWGIDGDVFRDPDGGAEYLFYSYLYEPRWPGAGIVLDSLLSPTRLAGRPTHVVRGSEAWEDKDGDPNNGSVRYTNEAPTVLKRNGRYYMIYSGGSWDLPTYSLGYAFSDNIKQGGLDGPGWLKVIPQILRSTNLVQAPGHNTVVKAPNNVDDITAYHARVVPFRSLGDRQTFLDRLYWQHDRPYMEPPSLAAKPAPDQPTFQDLFDRPDGALGRDWNVTTGAWRVVGNQARQGDVVSGLVFPRSEALNNYVFEANVRIPKTAAPPAAQGAAGVAAYYLDNDNYVDVWLDAGRRALVTSGVIAHRPVPEEVSSLDHDFRFDAYHQILVTKNADRIRVSLDGVNTQDRQLNIGKGGVALRTRHARADFDGVALTPYFEDGFSDPSLTWKPISGTWLVGEGALHQVAGSAGRYVALKGDSASDYEFTASVRWRDNESVASKAGVVAAATAAGEMVLGGFDRTIWPYTRFWVQHIVGGAVEQSFGVELPRGFNYDVYHTIRAVKQGAAITFFLDGAEMASARFPINAARPGLFTEGVRAAFDDVAMKRLVIPGNLVLDGSFEAEPWERGTSAPEPPWVLSDSASVNACCAHTGSHRLLLTAADAKASQVVTGLTPGSYTLYAWVTTRNAEADIRVTTGVTTGVTPGVTTEGDAARQGSASGGAWQRVAVDFEVPDGRNAVTVSVGGRFGAGTNDIVAVDDLYLFKH